MRCTRGTTMMLHWIMLLRRPKMQKRPLTKKELRSCDQHWMRSRETAKRTTLPDSWERTAFRTIGHGRRDERCCRYPAVSTTTRSRTSQSERGFLMVTHSAESGRTMMEATFSKSGFMQRTKSTIVVCCLLCGGGIWFETGYGTVVHSV